MDIASLIFQMCPVSMLHHLFSTRFWNSAENRVVPILPKFPFIQGRLTEGRVNKHSYLGKGCGGRGLGGLRKGNRTGSINEGRVVGGGLSGDI